MTVCGIWQQNSEKVNKLCWDKILVVFLGGEGNSDRRVEDQVVKSLLLAIEISNTRPSKGLNQGIIMEVEKHGTVLG